MSDQKYICMEGGGGLAGVDGLRDAGCLPTVMLELEALIGLEYVDDEGEAESP